MNKWAAYKIYENISECYVFCYGGDYWNTKCAAVFGELPAQFSALIQAKTTFIWIFDNLGTY